jgi:hypothetical protein
MRVLPDFDELAKTYPGAPLTADQVKKAIGGSVNSPDIDDTCIVRISKPLNDRGHSIPPWTDPFRTRKGSDGRWYGLRVDEFWKYMVRTYGAPTVTELSPLHEKNFRGIRGIIGFRVPFKGATGHFTLWDGYKLLYNGGDPVYCKLSTVAGVC